MREEKGTIISAEHLVRADIGSRIKFVRTGTVADQTIEDGVLSTILYKPDGYTLSLIVAGESFMLQAIGWTGDGATVEFL